MFAYFFNAFLQVIWVCYRVQAYPSDRSEEMATHPRGAPPPRVTSARSQGKWSLICVKFEI